MCINGLDSTIKIEITHFVFHLLRKIQDGFCPTFLRPATLAGRPKQFFEQLIGRHLDSPRYLFVDDIGARTSNAKSNQVQELCHAIGLVRK